MDEHSCATRRIILIAAMGTTVLLASVVACRDANAPLAPVVTQGQVTPAVGTVAPGVAGATAGLHASPVPATAQASEHETPSVAPDSLVTLEFVTQPPPPGQDEGEGARSPSAAEMAAIVRKMLEFALVEHEIPDYHMLDDKQNVVLSTENIDAGLVSDPPGVHLVALRRLTTCRRQPTPTGTTCTCASRRWR